MLDVGRPKSLWGGEWDIPSETQEITAEKTSARKRRRNEGSSKRIVRSLMKNESKDKDHPEIPKDLVVRCYYNSVRVNRKGFNR